MATLTGMNVVADSEVTRTRTAGKTTRAPSTAPLGLIWLRIAQMIQQTWENRPRRKGDDGGGEVLHAEAVEAWLASERNWLGVTELSMPGIPADLTVQKAPRPTEVWTLTWAGSPACVLAAWEVRLTTPTALVTRRARPREEITTHACPSGRSYLGPNYTPDYKPRHAAQQVEPDRSGQTAHAEPTRASAASVVARIPRPPTQRTPKRPSARVARPAGDRSGRGVRPGQQVHANASRPRRRADRVQVDWSHDY